MSFKRVLDPVERISELLFGLIMALTFTCTLGVATADNMKVQTMLIGALGCNLAWGIIDAGVYLLARLHDQGRKILILLAMRQAPDLGTAQRIIADALPPVVASITRRISCGAVKSLFARLRFTFWSSAMRFVLVCKRPAVSQIRKSILFLAADS